MGTITLVGHLWAKSGKEQALGDLGEELAAVVRAKDSGTLSYGFYETGEAGHYIAVEVYKDSESVISHLDHVAEQNSGSWPSSSTPRQAWHRMSSGIRHPNSW